jgi:hypothetical protein
MKTEKRTCPTCGQRKPTAAFGDSTSCRVCMVTIRPASARSLEEHRRMRKVYDRLHIGALMQKRGAA